MILHDLCWTWEIPDDKVQDFIDALKSPQGHKIKFKDYGKKIDDIGVCISMVDDPERLAYLIEQHLNRKEST